MQIRKQRGQAILSQIPSHQSIPQGLELLYNQAFRHNISKLLGSLNLVDINFTIWVGFSLHVLLEEVELHSKELARRSDP